MTPNNHQRETRLLNASSSPDNSQNDPHNHKLNYSLLPPLSGSSPLLSEIPERLLQDEASTRCPSYNEQDVLTGRQSLQEGICSPEEEPSLHQDPAWQERSTSLRHERIQDQYEHASESSGAFFQGWHHSCQDARKSMPTPRSWKDKLGTFAIIVLVTGSILLCAAVGTLSFLWFGGPDIPAWKEITARNWLSKAISICIGVIQQVMTLQLGIVTATIASLTLESGDVLIGDIASVSIMRATAASTGVFAMAWQYLSGGSLRSARQLSSLLLIFSAALLWCLSQFLLLILLTDVSLRSTAGLAGTVHLPYSLFYNLTYEDSARTSFLLSNFFPGSTGAWHSHISDHASFAEYSEPPYEADGVSDTGVTLRAFLPFGTAQTRENLKSYKGKATVLDARVTCQVPQIQNATVDSLNRFRGSLAATRHTPRLANATLGDDSSTGSVDGIIVNTDRSRDFDCIASWPRNPKLLWSDQWAISLCQLWRFRDSQWTEHFGGLVSEFRDPTRVNGSINGAAYLYLNCTPSEREEGYTDHLEYADELDPILIAESSHERGEWLDLTFSNSSVTISASLCYAAFDFADIDVRISSQSNRTESRLKPDFDRDTRSYTFKELRYAMGQDRSLPLEKRSTLQLEKGHWQAVSQEDYAAYEKSADNLRSTADMAFTKSYSLDDPEYYNSTMTSAFYTSGCTLTLDYRQGYPTSPACIRPDMIYVSAYIP